MRIGYIHMDYEEWNKGTYNTQEIGLGKAFEELGHETIIVYWVKPQSPKCFTEQMITKHVKKIYLPMLRRFKHHVIFQRRILEKYQFDLLHIQSDNLFFVPAITRWCRKKKIPHYCYVGTIESSNPNPRQRMLMNLMARRNIRAFKKSRIFTKTPAMQQQLQKAGVKDVTVVPVGLDFSIIPPITQTKTQLRSELGLALDKTIILCISHLRPSRHPLDIFELTDKLDQNFQIVFIGFGALEDQFQDMLAKGDRQSKMIYIPFVPNKDIHQYYACADYFVNLNYEEIFGMAILEAMYQGCTVIARHAPGPDYIIKNNETGYLADSIGEMSKLILDGKNVESISKEEFRKLYGWNTSAEAILNYTKQA